MERIDVLKSIEKILVNKAYETGHISHRKDGDWQKQADGSWIPYKGDGKQSSKKPQEKTTDQKTSESWETLSKEEQDEWFDKALSYKREWAEDSDEEVRQMAEDADVSDIARMLFANRSRGNDSGEEEDITETKEYRSWSDDVDSFVDRVNSGDFDSIIKKYQDDISELDEDEDEDKIADLQTDLVYACLEEAGMDHLGEWDTEETGLDKIKANGFYDIIMDAVLDREPTNGDSEESGEEGLSGEELASLGRSTSVKEFKEKLSKMNPSTEDLKYLRERIPQAFETEEVEFDSDDDEKNEPQERELTPEEISELVKITDINERKKRQAEMLAQKSAFRDMRSAPAVKNMGF